jgi:hypothetical protein
VPEGDGFPPALVVTGTEGLGAVDDCAAEEVDVGAATGIVVVGLAEVTAEVVGVGFPEVHDIAKTANKTTIARKKKPRVGFLGLRNL